MEPGVCLEECLVYLQSHSKRTCLGVSQSCSQDGARRCIIPTWSTDLPQLRILKTGNKKRAHFEFLTEEFPLSKRDHLFRIENVLIKMKTSLNTRALTLAGLLRRGKKQLKEVIIYLRKVFRSSKLLNLNIITT